MTTNEVMRIDVSGSVGIGSASPVERLTIDGTNPRIFLDDSSVPGTTTNRLYAVSGNLYWNGVGLTVSGSLPSPAEGNVIRGSGPSSWQTTSDLYIASSSGNVGIGTTNPIDLLHVFAGAGGRSSFDSSAVAVFEKNGDASITIATPDANSGYIVFADASSAAPAYIGYSHNTNAYTFYGKGNGSHIMTIDSSGQVGIGTTNPTSELEVNSSAGHTIVTIHADNGYGSRIQFDTGDTAQIRAYNGNGVAADRSLAFQVGGNTYQHIKNNGRIGINTTSPLSQLHIRGHVSQSHSGSLFRVEGSSGSLFEVVDSLSGSLMSVNDISGLPIFEVFSDDKVIMGQYGQNALVVTGSRVGIGTAAPIASLDVSGSIVISDSSGTFTLPSTQQLFLDGGGDTYIREYSADLIQFVAGGNSAL
jgi:hypothetical protein